MTESLKLNVDGDLSPKERNDLNNLKLDNLDKQELQRLFKELES
jgi:hypothetical protein